MTKQILKMESRLKSLLGVLVVQQMFYRKKEQNISKYFKIFQNLQKSSKHNIVFTDPCADLI